MTTFYSRILSGVLLVAISFLSSSCNKKSSSSSQQQGIDSSQAKDAKPTKNDWMVVQLAANPSILNPVLATDAYSSAVTPYVFDTLISYRSSDGEPEGKAAKDWTVSKDGLTYEFNLREGLTFHDGKPVTAEDVKFSFDVIKNPKVDAAHLQNYYKDLDSVEVVSPTKVRCHMKQVYYRNLIVLGLVEIIPKHLYGIGDFNKSPQNRTPVGSGPYRFKKWDQGRSIELERNRDWWGLNVPEWKDRYNFNRIIYKIISEPNVALMALKKGELDSIDPTPKQWMNELNTPEIEQRFYKLRYDTQDGNGYGYIGWNSKLPKFQSKKVRQALAYLMPREEINKKVFGGIRTLSVGPFPAASPRNDPSLKPIPFDKDKALTLLAEEGWQDTNRDGILDKGGEKFSFELLYTQGAPENDQVALIYRETLKSVGIEMNIRSLEWSVYLKQLMEDKFDAVLMGWGSSLDSDPYQIWHSSQAAKGGSNRVKFKNDRADQIMDEARKTLDSGKRNVLFQELSRIIADEAPYLFMLERPNLFIATKRFQGVLPVGKLGTDSSLWFTPTGFEKYKD